jgi:predicted extracellular nuclease
MIYKPGKVTPVGSAQNYQTNFGGYTNVFDRPPLAQTFTANGDKFTVLVNHFKSRGSCPATFGLDSDLGDGQGCWNAKRVAQAGALLGFISQLQTSSGDKDVVVLGDLNSYAEEDPIDTLVAGGLVNLVLAKLPAEERYTYVFDGMLGYLDHMLVTPSMAAKNAGVTIWHINSDEPTILDYNQEFNPPSSTARPFRASDHDPVIASFLHVYYLPSSLNKAP